MIIKSQTENTRWSLFERVLFRYVFILFVLFITFYNNGAFPFFRYIIQYPTELLHLFVPWVAERVLKLPEITVFPNGSGDTTYSYVLLLCVCVVSATGCFIWTLIDRKNKNYNRLYYWLTVAVRFYLAFMLIQYGMVKVIKLQFPFPDLSRLSSTYGESSPMGLAWTFLGFSAGYNLFMGIAEVMAILLLFRRTLTLGAIITLMTTANVMAVNYFYDVPVKILSTALFLMTIYLLVPNFKRLFAFFIKGEAVQLRSIEPPVIKKKWLENGMLAFKIAIITIPILFSAMALLSRKEHFEGGNKLPLYGIYEVESFVWDKKDSTENTVYAMEWKTLIIETNKRSVIKFSNDLRDYCDLNIDTVKKTISLTFKDEPETEHNFAYRIPSPEYLDLTGSLFGNPVAIKFKKKKLQLMERGFNWVNEHPFNR